MTSGTAGPYPGRMSDQPTSSPDPVENEAPLDPAEDRQIELDTFDLDHNGKISLMEEGRARMGLLDARLEEAAEKGGITGKIAGVAHKITDKLDND
jgi:hypothetical protein